MTIGGGKCGGVVASIVGVILFSSGLASAAVLGLDGQSVSASMQPLDPVCGIINQFPSPQTVGPGVEFTGGQFTPNAAGFPLNVQLINSFGMNVDISSFAMQVILLQEPGSITGLGANFPLLRVNVGGLVFPGGNLTGITETSGPPVVAAFLTGPHSVAIDFDSFGPPSSYDFAFITAVPEPGCGVLMGIVAAYEIRKRRSRRL